MIVTVITSDSKKLNSTILSAMKTQVEFWSVKKDRRGYNVYACSIEPKYTNEDLYIKTYIDPHYQRLEFSVIDIYGERIPYKTEYGHLLGRFVQVLLAHFSDDFRSIEIS